MIGSTTGSGEIRERGEVFTVYLSIPGDILSEELIKDLQT